MIQTIPNSHFWTNIEMLIQCIKTDPNITKEYIIKGLENTLEQGYDIQLTKKGLKNIEERFWKYIHDKAERELCFRNKK